MLGLLRTLVESDTNQNPSSYLTFSVCTYQQKIFLTLLQVNINLNSGSEENSTKQFHWTDPLVTATTAALHYHLPASLTYAATVLTEVFLSV